MGGSESSVYNSLSCWNAPYLRPFAYRPSPWWDQLHCPTSHKCFTKYFQWVRNPCCKHQKFDPAMLKWSHYGLGRRANRCKYGVCIYIWRTASVLFRKCGTFSLCIPGYIYSCRYEGLQSATMHSQCTGWHCTAIVMLRHKDISKLSWCKQLQGNI